MTTGSGTSVDRPPKCSGAALSTRRLTLHYEPIVDIASGRVAGFEGLPWLTDGGAPMSADEIADAAEATGLAADLGDWVLARALADLNRLRGFVGVNVAAPQLRVPDYADRVTHAIDQARADPRRVVLEISDAELGEDADQAWSQLTALSDAGVRVAIDDYGTGNTSLGHLRQPAVDVISSTPRFSRTAPRRGRAGCSRRSPTWPPRCGSTRWRRASGTRRRGRC